MHKTDFEQDVKTVQMLGSVAERLAIALLPTLQLSNSPASLLFLVSKLPDAMARFAWKLVYFSYVHALWVWMSDVSVWGTTT